jgi:hypothetical protein
MKEETSVNAITLDDDLTNLESNEIKIDEYDSLSGFYISKSENTMIRCMTRRNVFNIALNNNVIISKGVIPIDDSFPNLVYFVEDFFFSSKAMIIEYTNIYYIQINSISDNYYRIYDYDYSNQIELKRALNDRNANSEMGIIKIFSLYNETTDMLYCIYIFEDKIKYFSMIGVTNMFNIQSYSKTYKIISNTREEYTLENDLIDMTKDYGAIEIGSTLEIRNSNDYKYYNILVEKDNLNNFPYNKTTNILTTIQTDNYWFIYSFAFIDEDMDYLRIFDLTNINITIETCAFQCSS